MKWFFVFWMFPLLALTEFGVTYEFSGGRFGDNLLAYLHAKWVAYTHHIPLLYKPFPYSDLLVLSQREKAYRESELYMHVKWPPSSPINTARPIVYTCPYFPEDRWEQLHLPVAKGWHVDWKNPEFRKQALELLAPTKPLELILPPPGVISIALHYREGGGYDLNNWGWPVKFPHFQFYIDGLLKMVELTRGRSLYCYVFTDARFPGELVKQIRDALPFGTPIEFDYRKAKNRHNLNVLEDFFSLFHYDILIHPQSNFSIIPSLLHDYAICHYPTDGEVIGETSVVTETSTEIQTELLEKLLLNLSQKNDETPLLG